MRNYNVIDNKYNDNLEKQLVEGKTIQEILGISAEDMVKYYEYGNELSEDKRYKDAADVFLFLSTLNPFVYEVWLSLALIEHHNQHWDFSFFAFQKAIALDPFRKDAYIKLMECLKDLKEYDCIQDYLLIMDRTLPDEARAFRKELREFL